MQIKMGECLQEKALDKAWLKLNIASGDFMRDFLLIMVMCVIGYLPLQAEEVLQPIHQGKALQWGAGLEFVPSLGYALSTSGDDSHWLPHLNRAFGITASFSPSEKFELCSGIEEQRMGSTGKFIHPFPYVLNMEAKIHTRAIRIPVSLNWKVFTQNDLDTIYLGFGAYVDRVYFAEVNRTQTYVSGNVADKYNFRDALPALMPGLQVQVGSRHEYVTMELRYWIDIEDFTVPGINAGKLRRSNLGLGFRVDLLKYMFE